MSSSTVTVEMPDDFNDFHLPQGVQRRLQDLLDKQDQGQSITSAEQEEAEGLVDMAEWLSLLKLRTQRHISENTQQP